MRKVMLYAAGLLVAAACAKMETEIPDVTKSGEVWTATVEAVRGVDTRSLAEDGSAIFSFWGGLDEVKVYVVTPAFIIIGITNRMVIIKNFLMVLIVIIYMLLRFS